MTLCAACHEKESSFDPYLCAECAKALSINELNVQEAYTFSFNCARVYLKMLLEDMKERGEIWPEGQYTHIYNAPAVHFYNARRFNYFSRLAQRVEHLEGDYVECGVGNGQSLLFLTTLAFDSLMPRNIWGFDSFAGPQKITDGDLTEEGTFWKPVESDYENAVQKFINSLTFYGLPGIWVNSHLTVIRGYFERSLKEYTGDSIALLHLDCNYHDSYASCLEQLWPKVVRGGIVMVDEYVNTFDSLRFPGARRAIDEFLLNTGEIIKRDKMYGKFFFIKGDCK